MIGKGKHIDLVTEFNISLIYFNDVNVSAASFSHEIIFERTGTNKMLSLNERSIPNTHLHASIIM